jgi:hypothetical protein
MMEEFDVRLNKDMIHTQWQTFGWPKAIHDQIEKREQECVTPNTIIIIIITITITITIITIAITITITITIVTRYEQESLGFLTEIKGEQADFNNELLECETKANTFAEYKDVSASKKVRTTV